MSEDIQDIDFLCRVDSSYAEEVPSRADLPTIYAEEVLLATNP
jgi:hypothetical protein